MPCHEKIIPYLLCMGNELKDQEKEKKETFIYPSFISFSPTNFFFFFFFISFYFVFNFFRQTLYVHGICKKERKRKQSNQIIVQTKSKKFWVFFPVSQFQVISKKRVSMTLSQVGFLGSLIKSGWMFSKGSKIFPHYHRDLASKAPDLLKKGFDISESILRVAAKVRPTEN